MRKRAQFLANMSYQPGVNQIVNLNADGFCRDIEVFFSASVTTIGSETGGETVQDPSQPWAILMAGTGPLTLEIQPGDEQSSVKVLDCQTLWLDTMRLAKRIPILTNGFTNTSTSGELIKGSFILPFAAMMSAYTKVSELDLRSRTTARFKWTAPSLANLLTALSPQPASGATITVQSMNIEFYQIDAVDVGYAMAYQHAYSFDVMPLQTSGFNRWDLAIKPGERLRALTIEVVTQSGSPAQAVPSNTLCDQGYLKIGPNTDHQFYIDGIQNHNRNQYQIREPDFPTGAFILDLDEDGHFQALPTPASAAERIYLYLNCPSSPPTGAYARIKKEIVVSNATA